MSTNGQQYHRIPIQAVCFTVCSKYKEMYGKYRTVKLLLVNITFSVKNKRKLTSEVVLGRLCRFNWRIQAF